MGQFRDNFKKGLFWTAIDKYSGQIIGILISMVLARLLTPYDYGIVATASVFINFISTFTSIGIGPAIIQRKDFNQTDIDNIFTFTIIIGLTCGLIFFGSSWLVADMYNNKMLIPVMQLFSISVFLGAVNMVPSALMAKNLRFREMATRNLLFQIIFGVLGIVCAFYGAGVYALICPALASSICMFFYNSHFYPVRLRLNFSIEPIKKIFSFSSYLFLFELSTYFSRNIDKFIIGKYISSNALGYYEKSYRLMQMPLQNITAVVYPVLQPILSSFQDNLKELTSKCTKILSYLALVGFPLCSCLYFCADEIINIMFGEQWGEAVPPFKILSLSVPVLIIFYPTGPIFLACNSSKKLFYSGIINTSITIITFLIAASVHRTIEAIAWGYTISLVIGAINTFCILYLNVLKTSLWPLVKSMLHPLICTLIIAAVYYCIDDLLILLPGLVRLIVKVLICLGISLIYYCSVRVLDINVLLKYIHKDKRNIESNEKDVLNNELMN